jgi:hypothetical protein
MSVNIYFKPVTGVFNDYIVMELSKLIPGRYRIGGISFVQTTTTATDHVFMTTQHYSYGDFIYRSYWNIVGNKACYCWFLDLRITKYAVSTIPFVLHQITGLYSNNLLLSQINVNDANYAVWGGSNRMQEQENDTYKAFLRDVSLASLM